MNTLWNRIDVQPWHPVTKFKAAAAVVSCLSALLGFLIWLVLRTWILSGTDWMLCFIGYPAVFSWFGVYLYYCSHRFKDERKIH